VAAGSLLAAGCVTQDQLRTTEAQTVEQKQAVQALRADAGRSESSISELRSELKRTQSSVHDLEVALADQKSRTDATQASTRDFLANLVAAREEQRRQLAESHAAFTDVKRKLADLEMRLQAQQRALEQASATLTEANRRLAAAETGLADAGRKAKAGQEADATLTRQVQTLQVQVTETRSVISSEGLLKLMREVQGVQRDTAALRGAIEELEHGQTEAATRSKNYYLDLDARIQALKQNLSRQAEALPAAPQPAEAPLHESTAPLPAVVNQ
jgi:predicted  nucleic acid-binding Zn-ribbon protein